MSGNLSNEVEGWKVEGAQGRAERNLHVALNEKKIHEEANVRMMNAFIFCVLV